MGQKQSTATTRFPEQSPETLKELHGSHTHRFEEPPASACCAASVSGDHETIGNENECSLSKFLKEDYDQGKVFDHECYGYDFGYHVMLQTQGMVHKKSQILVVENAIDMREGTPSTVCIPVFHYTSIELAKGILTSALTSEPEVVAALQATAEQAGLGQRIVVCEKSPQQLGSKTEVLKTLYASGDSDPEDDPNTKELAQVCIPLLIGPHRILDFSKEFVKEIIPITSLVNSSAPPVSARSNASDKIFESMQARVDTLSETLGPNNVEAMLATGVLANSLRSAGHSAEAAMLYRDLLQKTAEHFGLEHEYTLIAMGNLAATTRLMGNFSAAESLGKQRLELSERSLGTRAQGTMAALRGLILTLCEQGKWAEAQKYKTIEERLKSGEDVPIMGSTDQ
jgi:hypothetical protein